MKPLWFLRRLQAMSPAEVAHRLTRAARHPLDRLRMRAGRYAPVPAEVRAWTGPARFYAGLDAAPVPLDAADRICRGEREVLGLGWLALGDAPWHVEPLAGAEWPRVDSARVIASAPTHFDARVTWELNRGHDWVTLARAFAATGEARYRDQLRADLASWTTANPLGTGINWASAMEAAIRIHSLAWIAALTREPVGALLHEHVTFVERNLSRFSSANNHLIVELSALAVASRALWGRAHAAALAELDREVARQVYADGVNAEMATHYHAFVLEALLLVTHLERAHGEPRHELEATARRMADYLWHLRTESGALLEQGDSDDGKIIPLLADDHAARVVAAAHGDALFGGAVPPLPACSRLFDASGQVVLRSLRLHVTFDVGPFGFGSLAAHAHCDALAINVAVDGKPFLVDRGTYRYNGDREARDRFRMTAAHNTLQVDGKEQGEPAGPFLWRRRPTVTLERCELGEIDLVVASHDGFGTPHRRTLVREGDLLVIIDEVDVPAVARFHLSPGSPGDALCAERAESTPFLHSPRYAATVPATTVEARLENGRLVTAVAAGRERPDQRSLEALVRRTSGSRTAP